jgi:tetratricopeptide (TPR) repeat protein
MTRRTYMLAAALFLVSARALPAQMEHEHGGTPPATLGHVTFSTSCSAQAQPIFERGVALMHSFWYEEASRTFREAQAADTACAMAYWGLASSYLHPLWAPPPPADLAAGATAVARARALAASTPREHDYVEAIGAYFDEYATVPHGQRLRRWSQAMARLHEAHPEDTEASIFYALTLIALAQSAPQNEALQLQRGAGAILEPLFARQPNHPGLAHYLIHAYDSPALAAQAASAVKRYASIAPSVPHARHMPSHIYTRLGQWDRSIASNTSSARAAREYEVAQHLPGVWDQRLHAMDYLVYAYLQEGRDGAARRIVEEAAGITSYVPEHGATSEYALAAIPARYALERGQWREAAQLAVRAGFVEGGALAVTRFARVVGAARAGDTAAARADFVALVSIDSDLTSRAVPKWSGMVHAQRLAAEAWLVRAGGDTAAAVRLAGQAADLEDATEKHPVTPGAILPARELLGDMLLELGRPAAARAAYDSALALQPRRARSLMGASRAAEQAGDRAGATRYRRELRTLLAKADAARRAVAMRRSE